MSNVLARSLLSNRRKYVPEVNELVKVPLLVPEKFLEETIVEPIRFCRAIATFNIVDAPALRLVRLCLTVYERVVEVDQLLTDLHDQIPVPLYVIAVAAFTTVAEKKLSIKNASDSFFHIFFIV